MNSLVVAADAKKLPEHLLNATGKGMENVDQSMLTLPRVKLLQDMSPEVKKSSDRRIEGAEPGHLMLSTGSELFEEMFVINLKLKTGFVAFSEESKMPFRAMAAEGEEGADGLFSSKEKAESALIFEGIDPDKVVSTPGQQAPRDGYTLLESHRHYVLVLDPESGRVKTPAVVDFIKTKVAISKNWNTMIATQGGDRYSSVWRVGAKVQTWGDNSWYNYDVSFHGWATDELYKEADKVFAGL